MARSGIDRCVVLLRTTLDSVGAVRGTVFALDGEQGVRLVVTSGEPTGDCLVVMEQAALRRLEAAQLPSDRFGWDRFETPTGVCLVAPISVDGELLGLIVATELRAVEISLETYTERSAPFIESVGLAMERLQMLEALRQREDEIGALRGQLDVYAMDFRSTYKAERDRSQELAEALSELERTYRATVRGLAIAVEAKDECTGGHLQRVSRYGMMLTALVAPEHAEDPQFEYGFLLHDIGKLTVPDGVLMKPGSLTEVEWELIRTHPASGHSILDGIPFLAGAREIVYSHHERWDGAGYPRGLAAEQIPLGAQIFPLCDAFDAMTSDRPYRKALPIEEARGEVARGAGSQFWPDAVEAFLSLPLGSLESIRDESYGGSS
jgi:ribonuclease P protein subunit RPR2